MLAMADAEGFVRASPSALARRACVSPAQCTRALRILLAPDRHSRSQEKQGRRIEAGEGGWQLINYTAYREIRTLEQLRAAQRQRKHRQQKRDPSRDERDDGRDTSPQGEAEVQKSEATPDAEVTGSFPSPSAGQASKAFRSREENDNGAPPEKPRRVIEDPGADRPIVVSQPTQLGRAIASMWPELVSAPPLPPAKENA